MFRHLSSAATVEVENEPCLNYLKGSEERQKVEEALKELRSKTEEIPCVIGGEEIFTGDIHYQVCPHNHQHKLAKFHYASADHIRLAIDRSLAIRAGWEKRPMAERADIFLEAARLLSEKYRYKMLAATMLGQGKNIQQAEIDAAAELIDFWRWNAKHSLDLQKQQPISTEGVTNSVIYRGLEGFVAAVSPFNFTAIGGNLSGAPAMMGNVVLWKPSDTAMLSSWIAYNIMREAGLPEGVINFVPADGPTFGDTITSSPHLAAINFTGSVQTFQHLWRQVGQNLGLYRTFPRLVGECGGKNYHFVHSSADMESVANGTIRSAFEYGGQKCSACSRMYVPTSMWPKLKDELLSRVKEVKMGDADDFTTFISAVIDDKSFGRIKNWLDHARSSPNLNVIAGGNCDDSRGYFVEPTIIETSDPREKIMQEEIFGPVLTVYPYPDEKYREVLEMVNETSPFGLTGAVFAKDVNVVKEAHEILKMSAGNFYINDKSTGSVVMQQPFGGARLSGTNDKAGGPHYVLKFCSPQSIKESHVPLADWKYGNMQA
ncbi:PREDICTED: delta-1-pyrroline-5-carboxylate dehydrogenase, mitochondrial-like isoform X2 [Branchiostoma belcheri]|uniref:Multifunctional fusion protein n=1 Tax=Branchiostoma belcheri TaxID=7741 RepID=A0A6P4Z260_BRABE|nr:PREDICTED: delta-1-pyrroline-5-carboxylate dehydrogenase, mitochondrial-like isoform X2 [Branchiostoma belcheri]